jgi:hypothetical protein
MHLEIQSSEKLLLVQSLGNISLGGADGIAPYLQWPTPFNLTLVDLACHQ